ncbi:phosphatase PAP2 family protein [Kribbella antibiotica]|uniref:Phosphatase PAP2 family protein n=1 Tax=Kribbella antibiotica TaxID=190195 RepID=A0A4R4ZUJ0_9ACTN|nr:phosphatase PAP2 family protein [Kribbella antibiotica]TDD60742.1 phosphatase PAP2 family protein [Kribbella antibiotica]
MSSKLSAVHRWALICLAGFLALAVFVTVEPTDSFDRMLREVFRPDDVWGPWQWVFGNVVDGAGPPVALAALAVAGVVASVRRKSWWPVFYVGRLAVVTVVITQVTKALFGRPDPHNDVGMFNGSYPSGHMVILLSCLGGILLVWRQRPPLWSWWLVLVAELTMGFSLLLLSMHWFTDVIGGGLLAVPIIVVAASPRFLRPVHRTSSTAVDSVGSHS